jgi:hypothetical protein
VGRGETREMVGYGVICHYGGWTGLTDTTSEHFTEPSSTGYERCWADYDAVGGERTGYGVVGSGLIVSDRQDREERGER